MFPQYSKSFSYSYTFSPCSLFTSVLLYSLGKYIPLHAEVTWTLMETGTLTFPVSASHLDGSKETVGYIRVHFKNVIYLNYTFISHFLSLSLSLSLWRLILNHGISILLSVSGNGANFIQFTSDDRFLRWSNSNIANVIVCNNGSQFCFLILLQLNSYVLNTWKPFPYFVSES